MYNFKKGFTLIELLIVITIIGILASTVIVSLSGNTGKANDASVTLGVLKLRTAAISEESEITASNTDILCDKVRPKVVSGKVSDNWTTSESCTSASQANTGLCCSSYGRQWAVWGKLDKAEDYYCSDSRGNIRKTGSPLAIIQDGTVSTNGIKCK